MTLHEAEPRTAAGLAERLLDIVAPVEPPRDGPTSRSYRRAVNARLDAIIEAARHLDHPFDGYTYEGCPGCHPSESDASVASARGAERAALVALRAALEDVRRTGRDGDYCWCPDWFWTQHPTGHTPACQRAQRALDSTANREERQRIEAGE